MLLSVFSCNVIKVNHYIQFLIFTHSTNSTLHNLSAPGSNGYEMTLSHFCNLLSSFPLNSILLIFSANILCASPLNLCFKTCFVIFEFKFSFYYALLFANYTSVVSTLQTLSLFFHPTHLLLAQSLYFLVMVNGLSTS